MIHKWLAIFLLNFLYQTGYGQLITMRESMTLMGSHFEITVTAENDETAKKYISDAVGEIKRIEKMISSWDSESQTSKINLNAGLNPVEVDPELFHLIERAIRISNLTDGAFDISYASMDMIWKFDGTMTKMPSPGEIEASKAKVGYQHILLDQEEMTVFLELKGMKIGFGAIGKGYAADMAKNLLRQKGVPGGIINASGDMNVWGTQPDGKPWKAGIVNPLNHNKVFSWFDIDNSAVVTSGNYEKYAIIDGKRYAHIIDPRTGIPVHGLTSVTIFAPKAELADALATAVFVMGKETGIDFVNQIQGIECVIVTDDGEILTSKNIQINKDEQ